MLYIFGKRGFIANELIEKLKKKKIHHKAFSKKDLNLEDEKSITKIKKSLLYNSNIIMISAIAPCKNTIDFKRNIKMAKNISKALTKKKINQLIYISSDAVYQDTKKKISEKTRCLPSSLHGKMHLERETIFKKSFKNKLTILRPTLIYGKNDPHNGYGPNKFLRLVKKNKNILIFGKGEELRDHVSINDVTNIIIKCIGQNLGKTINIVSGKIISFLKIAKLCIKKNNKSKIIYIKRKGIVPHKGLRQFNISKLKKIYPSYKFEQLNKYIYNSK